MTLRQLIGSRIQRARRDRKWTQGELGARLEPWLGHTWARQQVHQAEAGLRAFEPGELVALCCAFDLPLWSLMNPALGQEVQLVSGGPVVTGTDVRRSLWSGAMTADEGFAISDDLKDRATALEREALGLTSLARQLEEDAVNRGRRNR